MKTLDLYLRKMREGNYRLFAEGDPVPMQIAKYDDFLRKNT